MRRFVTPFLIAILAIVSLSFGGMAFMDHGDDRMATGACMIGSCLDSHAGQMGGMGCVSHCLKAAFDLGSVPTTGMVQSVLLLSVVAAFFIINFREKIAPPFFRSDQGIARLLLHRQLTTVMMQD